MLLALDLGNSFIKFAVFKDDKVLSSGKFNYENFQDSLSGLLSNKISHVAFSTVKNTKIAEWLKAKRNLNIIELTATSAYPFELRYSTPETLGIDRLTACAGAYSIQKTGGFLVIDAGTCITYDYVDGSNCYLGGAISPGIHLRFKAMHQFTDLLPLISTASPSPPLVGDSTIKAMNSGVINSIIFEMNGFINEMTKKDDKINVYLTGGDAVFFENALKCSIFAEPLLNLKGINELIHFNA